MTGPLYKTPPSFAPGNGFVTIVTRSKSRPLMLSRAIKSVSEQTYEHWHQLVLLDEALPEVKAVAESASREAKGRISCIDVCSNGKIDALLSYGLQTLDSEFVAVLDEDDVWKPEFLSSMVGFLRSEAGQKTAGVVCWIDIVEEEVQGSKIVENRRFLHQPALNTMSLARSFESNRCFTNTFLFRRSAASQVGLYNKDLAYIGDWEFSLRFQLVHEIGIVSKVLAEYHHRPRAKDFRDGNTILHAHDAHEALDFGLRDQQIRDTLEKHPGFLGLFLLLGRYNLELTDRLVRIEKTAARIDRLFAPLILLKRLVRGFLSIGKPKGSSAR